MPIWAAVVMAGQPSVVCEAEVVDCLSDAAIVIIRRLRGEGTRFRHAPNRRPDDWLRIRPA
ncbi:MAG: hypothetical protein DMF89_07360 [Acidobacteria bacterium]|nr:MAG: hypothetical protein DMF89_07360 [Acidobacteriota bacterium]